MKAKMIGTGSYLPSNIITNADLAYEYGLETSDEWIIHRTGIYHRHIADKGKVTSDLATVALKVAIKNAEVEAGQLDGIIIATCTPDKYFPSTAMNVQSKLQLDNIFAFDINAACSGFIYALSIATSMIQAGQATRIAVIGAEVMSRIVDWSDRSTAILFGDGAGAVILDSTSPADTAKIQKVNISSLPNADILYTSGGLENLNDPQYIKMKGREVFKYAVEYMSRQILDILDDSNTNIEKVDWIILHQANKRILEAVAHKLKVPMSKMVGTIADHANTSAASIPLALDNYISTGHIKAGDNIVMAAIGAGITYGAIHIII